MIYINNITFWTSINIWPFQKCSYIEKSYVCKYRHKEKKIKYYKRNCMIYNKYFGILILIWLSWICLYLNNNVLIDNTKHIQIIPLFNLLRYTILLIKIKIVSYCMRLIIIKIKHTQIIFQLEFYFMIDNSIKYTL